MESSWDCAVELDEGRGVPREDEVGVASTGAERMEGVEAEDMGGGLAEGEGVVGCCSAREEMGDSSRSTNCDCKACSNRPTQETSYRSVNLLKSLQHEKNLQDHVQHLMMVGFGPNEVV